LNDQHGPRVRSGSIRTTACTRSATPFAERLIDTDTLSIDTDTL
jgi:hypothetical protein